MSYTQAAYQTLRDNGGTFTPDGYAVNYHEGYMVGGFAPTRMLPIMEGAPYARSVVAMALQDYAGANAETFDSGVERTYLGTWVSEYDGNLTLYIDATRHYDDKLTAVAHGLAHGELAVWDCAAGAEVSLAPYRAALQGVDAPTRCQVCELPHCECPARDMYGNNLRTGDSWGR